MEKQAGHDYRELLHFWFGSVEDTVIPSEHRARVWFGDNPQVDQEMKERFGHLHTLAIHGGLSEWEKTAHGQLALILLYDQFSRHLYRGTSKAFQYDMDALRICSYAVETQLDHQLSLIERVFFYFPLLHAESMKFQDLSVQCYHLLIDLALPETKVVYDSFLRFANHHAGVIRQFGRFPQRNQFVGRESTDDELAYLKQQENA